MSKLTFKDFFYIMEDGEQDIARIMAEISAIDVQLAQRTAPLIARKTQLSKQLIMKQKQAGQQAQQQPGQPMQAGTTTTTPGSAGASTPGGGVPQV